MTLIQRQSRSGRSDTSSCSNSNPQVAIIEHHDNVQNPTVAVDLLPREAQVVAQNDSQNAATNDVEAGGQPAPTAAEVPTAYAQPLQESEENPLIDEIELLQSSQTLGLFPSSVSISKACKEVSVLAGYCIAGGIIGGVAIQTAIDMGLLVPNPNGGGYG